jgi:hypothetical protein
MNSLVPAFDGKGSTSHKVIITALSCRSVVKSTVTCPTNQLRFCR